MQHMLSINMFYSMLVNTNIMENYQEERRKNKLQEAGLRLQVIKKTLRILFFGNPVRKMNQVGTLHGEKVDQDGILSAVRCQKSV